MTSITELQMKILAKHSLLNRSTFFVKIEFESGGAKQKRLFKV